MFFWFLYCIKCVEKWVIHHIQHVANEKKLWYIPLHSELANRFIISTKLHLLVIFCMQPFSPAIRNVQCKKRRRSSVIFYRRNLWYLQIWLHLLSEMMRHKWGCHRIGFRVCKTHMQDLGLLGPCPSPTVILTGPTVCSRGPNKWYNPTISCALLVLISFLF